MQHFFVDASPESTKLSSPSFSMRIKPVDKRKMVTPSPGDYKPEHSEKYLEEKIQHSLGIKPSDPKKYITPSPGAYRPEHSEKYLEEKIQHSLGIKPSDPKKYITPSPNKYQVDYRLGFNI